MNKNLKILLLVVIGLFFVFSLETSRTTLANIFQSVFAKEKVRQDKVNFVKVRKTFKDLVIPETSQNVIDLFDVPPGAEIISVFGNVEKSFKFSESVAPGSGSASFRVQIIPKDDESELIEIEIGGVDEFFSGLLRGGIFQGPAGEVRPIASLNKKSRITLLINTGVINLDNLTQGEIEIFVAFITHKE